jgi:hypothetical protein
LSTGRPYLGDEPLDYVISLNEKRRHLTTSQRAMVAVEIANLPQGGDRRSEDFKAQNQALISAPEPTESQRAMSAAELAPLQASAEAAALRAMVAANTLPEPVHKPRAPVSQGRGQLERTPGSVHARGPRRRPVGSKGLMQQGFPLSSPRPRFAVRARDLFVRNSYGTAYRGIVSPPTTSPVAKNHNMNHETGR